MTSNQTIETNQKIEKTMSVSRKIWMTITEITTFLIPNIILSKDADQRQAWREKVTIFFWILTFSGTVIFIIGILPQILCPPSQYYTWRQIWEQTGNSWIVSHGHIYDISARDDLEKFNGLLGQDVSHLYLKTAPENIEELQYDSDKFNLFNLIQQDEKCNTPGDKFIDDDGNQITCYNNNEITNNSLTKKVGTLALDIHDLKSSKQNWFYIYDRVYDITLYTKYAENSGKCLISGKNNNNETEYNTFDNIAYCSENYKDLPFVHENCGNICKGYKTDDANCDKECLGKRRILNEECYSKVNTILECNITSIPGFPFQTISDPGSSDALFLDKRLNKIFTDKQSLNATLYFQNTIPEQNQQEIINYLDEMFFVGILDTRYSLVCEILDIVFLVVICSVAFIVVFKFLSSLFILAKQYPEQKDKYVIINMPCYTESVEEIEKTIFSVADLEYCDHNKKLLLVVADGLITGKGNDRPTAEIVLNTLGRSMKDQKKAYEYVSLGENENRINRAKVFTGIYQDPDNEKNSLPYLVIVKVGNSKETSKPGNRGKRDSQLVVFNFLSNLFYKKPLNSLQTKMYDDVKNILNINPNDYEYLMCIDSDTEPHTDALKQMIYKMAGDKKLIGLCGETRISNKYDSWVTAIQVYEYYINHHLNKAFESLFGNVTCLPGCFSMYRIKSTGKRAKAFVINESILDQYSDTNVDTLHKKNLLHLGEDRFLTTLLTKTFPNYSLKYITEAVCETAVPNSWSILLSQRRRWVNSTVHNLIELVQIKGMCGIAFFSMRFVVLLDLIATFLLPASVCYLYYLIYLFATGQEKIQLIMIIVISIVYGVQVAVFLIKRQLSNFMWLSIYILSMPIWTIIIPIYSFWKFDDFSWGKTRELSTSTTLDDSETETVSDTSSVTTAPDSISITIPQPAAITAPTNTPDSIYITIPTPITTAPSTTTPTAISIKSHTSTTSKSSRKSFNNFLSFWKKN